MRQPPAYTIDWETRSACVRPILSTGAEYRSPRAGEGGGIVTGERAGWQGRWVCVALNVVVVACALDIVKKEAEDAERHRLAEHMRNQSFVHSDILKDKLDEVRHCARFKL